MFSGSVPPHGSGLCGPELGVEWKILFGEVFVQFVAAVSGVV